jgi:CheY-like chemotaxis protein
MSHDPNTLLVVDDDPDTRDVLREFLQASGYGVLTADNGADALQVLQRDTSCCGILLDLMMPVMDGWQFLERKNTDQQLSRIPVIVISAYRERAPSKGVTDVVAKPIDFERLLRTLRQHCANRH